MAKKSVAQRVRSVLSENVAILNLSKRSEGALKNDNILSVGELIGKTESELLRLPNFGRHSLSEVKTSLAGHGLRLQDVGSPSVDSKEVTERVLEIDLQTLQRIREKRRLGIAKKTVRITRWLCPDGHGHMSKAAAQSCFDQIADREARRASVLKFGTRTEAEKKIREEALREDEERRRISAEKLKREQLEIKTRWQKSEMYSSSLDKGVSMTLFFEGVEDRAGFRERFITEDNVFDLAKLRQVPMLNIDDYTQILAWLNEQVTEPA